MKIASWNVNGIRALEKKGELEKFLTMVDPDILLMQETKARADQLSFGLTNHADYHQFYHAARKAGYAGTAIWAKKVVNPEVDFSVGMDDFDDIEGRVVTLRSNGLTILGVYFPNGGKSSLAWQGKLEFYEIFHRHVKTLREAGEKVIFAGDVNCCHQEIDIARPKENDGKIGFHPDERSRISAWVTDDWVDVWRRLNPERVDVYSWWSFRARARERNIGWRIDYFFVDEELLPRVRTLVYLAEQMGSDHCPVIMEIN